jgi:hypothetical protein
MKDDIKRVIELLKSVDDNTTLKLLFEHIEDEISLYESIEVLLETSYKLHILADLESEDIKYSNILLKIKKELEDFIINSNAKINVENTI